MRLGLYGRIASIQPIWAIDEYAIIFRVWVWFNPPQAPVKIDEIDSATIIIGCSS